MTPERRTPARECCGCGPAGRKTPGNVRRLGFRRMLLSRVLGRRTPRVGSRAGPRIARLPSSVRPRWTTGSLGRQTKCGNQKESAGWPSCFPASHQIPAGSGSRSRRLPCGIHVAAAAASADARAEPAGLGSRVSSSLSADEAPHTQHSQRRVELVPCRVLWERNQLILYVWYRYR